MKAFLESMVDTMLFLIKWVAIGVAFVSISHALADLFLGTP